MTSLLPRRTLLATLALTMGLVAGASADVVTLNPVKDATLYENAGGQWASGAGPTFFAGRTYTGFEDIRRGLLQFDVAGSVPGGSVITAVTLQLYMSRAVSADVSVTLHRVAQAWGEGASDAGINGGSGAGAAAGDATWLHTFYSGSTWTTPGGDFSALASATAAVGIANTFYTWGSSAQMVADVQDWLDNAAGNHGWLVKGDESTSGTAKRFDSRESSTVTADTRPRLTITYTPGVIPVEPTSWTRIKSLYR